MMCVLVVVSVETEQRRSTQPVDYSKQPERVDSNHFSSHRLDDIRFGRHISTKNL
jgi:hypothetical protein